MRGETVKLVFLPIKDGVILEVLYRPQPIETIQTVDCDVTSYRYILHPQKIIIIVGTDGCDVTDTLVSNSVHETDKPKVRVHLPQTTSLIRGPTVQFACYRKY
jgi:hypothetical protein